jgi:hypothetical protein
MSEVINHSIVGVSKVLHFFSPDFVPIIDSRVVSAWNHFFQHEKQVLLKGCQSSVPASKYLDYWKALLFWKEQTGLKGIRELEEPFYLIGG